MNDDEPMETLAEALNKQYAESDLGKALAENQTLRDERDRLREALQAFCDEVEMDAAAMAYKCDLGAGEWEAFIDRTKLYEQYLAAKAAMTPAEGGQSNG